MDGSGVFDDNCPALLTDLLAWRRDVRRFKTDPVPQPQLDALFQTFQLAPSVGNSQPWRLVRITSQSGRNALCTNFESANNKALTGYLGDRAKLYAGLKLSGLREAPVLMAVFTELEPDQGSGLGRQTMPETLHYSTVCGIHGMWLAAAAMNLGMGWVSIIDPIPVEQAFARSASWSLTAVLCLGFPETYERVPELQRAGWAARDASNSQIYES